MEPSGLSGRPPRASFAEVSCLASTADYAARSLIRLDLGGHFCAYDGARPIAPDPHLIAKGVSVHSGWALR